MAEELLVALELLENDRDNHFNLRIESPSAFRALFAYGIVKYRKTDQHVLHQIRLLWNYEVLVQER